MKPSIILLRIFNSIEQTVNLLAHPLGRKTHVCVIAAAMVTSLTSCLQDFDPGYQDDEMLCVNILAFPDSALTASITHSWDIRDQPESMWDGFWPPKRHEWAIVEADVECYLNDNPPVKMQFDAEAKIYRCDIKPEEGDRIRVKAISRKYGEAEGMTEIPKKVKFDRLSVETSLKSDHTIWINNLPALQATNRFSMTFTDPAEERNYYMLCIKYFNPTEIDPIFIDHETGLENVITDDRGPWVYIFSDANIDGKTYSLKLSNTAILMPSPDYGETPDNPEDWTYRFELRTISESYYLYLRSLQKKYLNINGAIEGMGLAEPKIVYSNVDPGVGIVAAASPAYASINTYDAFIKAYKEWQKQ